MSRKSCKRRVIRASAPVLVTMANTPDVSIAERIAVEAFGAGFAEYQHYRTVADVQGHLQLAARKKGDPEAGGIADMAGSAILSIYQRYMKTRKYGATGEEMKMLRLLVDYADDFWKRQTGGLLNECAEILLAIRANQLAEGRKKSA